MSVYINEIIRWRKALGLSQQALADYLGISRSLLASAETGQRTLPTSALVELVKLQKLSEVYHPPEKTAPRNNYPHWQKELNTLKRELIRLDKQRVKLEQNNDSVARCQVLCTQLQQHLSTLPNSPEKTGKQTWLNRHLTRSTDKPGGNPAFHYQKLKLETDVVQFQIQRIEEEHLKG